MTIYHGRPENCELRQSREVRVYDLLDSLGIEYDRLDHDPADTMEVCAQIDAAFERTTLSQFNASSDNDRLKHAIICKNLFLCNKQKTHFYLLMMPGDKKFLTRLLSQQINSARLSFADADAMLKYLDVMPGSVSVMGLMNDRANYVQLLIDEDVLKSEFVGCHPCRNTSSLRLKVKDLTGRILPAMKHEPQVVRLVEEE
ncbi:MAG: prolyl-tRNA synthetase associated domain-containing protein [Marinilabiliaceae bacterium]|nr:prolyl-tRNA synthetase associated domain-containing protein [Marinilabiliaceae bacterium]